MPDFAYIWDPRLRNGAGGYRDPDTGRIVSNATIQNSLDAYINASQDTPAALYQLLTNRQISVADWQLQMRDHIKNVNINAAVAAMGGRDQMTQADWGRVGQRIRTQYEYLDNFAQQLAAGLPINGNILSRMQMYTEAGNSTYEAFRRIKMGNAGYDMERSVLDLRARHCAGVGSCIEQAALDWVQIGRLIPIGERLCGSRCRCTMEYMNTQTGEIVR